MEKERFKLQVDRLGDTMVNYLKALWLKFKHKVGINRTIPINLDRGDTIEQAHRMCKSGDIIMVKGNQPTFNKKGDQKDD